MAELATNAGALADAREKWEEGDEEKEKPS